jgi:hypothetical protein
MGSPVTLGVAAAGGGTAGAVVSSVLVEEQTGD